jgi:hypothetical protein
VHLNSVDPEKAAEYYPKAFALSAMTTVNGYQGEGGAADARGSVKR